MDNSGSPKPFDDVARPENIPASPSARPVIVGNQTVQSDPMMSSNQVNANTSSQPSIPVIPPRGIQVQATESTTTPTTPVQSNINIDQSIAQPQPTAEPLHKLNHETAVFSQISKPKKRIFLIFFILIVIMAAVIAGAYLISS